MQNRIRNYKSIQISVSPTSYKETTKSCQTAIYTGLLTNVPSNWKLHRRIKYQLIILVWNNIKMESPNYIWH